MHICWTRQILGHTPWKQGTAKKARLLACLITQYQTCHIVGTAPVMVKEDMFDD